MRLSGLNPFTAPFMLAFEARSVEMPTWSRFLWGVARNCELSLSLGLLVLG